MNGVDDVGLFDVWRVIIAAIAMWMALLVTRLAWMRWMALRHDPTDNGPHPLSYASYAVALYAITAFRAVRLGHTPDAHLYADTVVVVLGLLGIGRQFRFGLRTLLRRNRR